MSARTRTAAILLAAASLLAGCAGDSSVERGLDRAHAGIQQSLDGSRVEERTFTARVDGIIDVQVDTFAGDVVIRGARDTGGEVRLTATVVGRQGRDREEDAEKSLADVGLQAELRRGGDVPTLVVKGTPSAKEAWANRTDLDIEVPELRRVRVHTREGKVFVFENRGGADIQTTDGEIRVLTPWAISEDVTLVTRGRDIVFRAFNGTCGRFDVDCVNGEVKARVERGDWRILDPRNDKDTLVATLGTCGNRMLMRNVDAKVIIAIVANPMDHGTFFSSP
jgi:hypothetical protein